MDFSEHHQAADMSSADLFEYLLNTDNDANFASLFPSDSLLPSTNNNAFPTVMPPQPQQHLQPRSMAPATRLLPTTSFSYRQISPNMPPPSNPTPIAIAPAPQLQPLAPAGTGRTTAAVAAPVHIKPILPKAVPKAAPSTASCIATATAVPTSASALVSPALFSSSSSVHSLASIPPSEDIWKERFHQLQQLQQAHRHKQHQLLSAAILSSPTATTLAPSSTPAGATTSSSSRASQSSSSSASQRGSSSERSVSPEKTTTDKLRTIYPSPPMNDDMAMESDSEARFGNGSEFAKPTESQLKLMTSKERRQLRNKLSARNFRVRRKEYIDHLENEVKVAKQETADIQRRLIQSELNCQFLRQELEATRLSQSLFGTSGDGRMSKEHANLLASLLNPNTETFPTVSNTETVQLSQEAALASTSWMDASLTTATGTSASGEPSSSAGTGAGATTIQSTEEEGQVPMEPFVPFDGDWSGLLINRAEVSEPVVDPKDTTATARETAERQKPAHELLARYEALKREAEHDAQMRAEIKADTDRRLAQTYMVISKGGDKDTDAMSIEVKRRLEEDSVVLKSLIYMLMVQLTESLFEAATLSKTDLVRMYQSMDEPLRAKMLAQSKECATSNKFAEWREAWIKRCWPSYYNNRRRVVELINRSGICDPCYRAKELKEKEIEEIARKMEEAVKDQTVGEVCKPNFFYKTFMPDRFKCPGVLAYEKIEAEAKAAAKASMMQKEQEASSMRATMTMPMPVAASVACV
ncbi:hypothetical protein BG015_011178 [Linnemannia schmuckeri]|uniref:BZIP domain-containing protein n=1 Tax=Linnemannia schmuckeri TaxID=64567 RepID=A0A9P5RVQ8_9FUNG|nr:hypothetical protein BG015_011178 [Linnemannia schmuckeri]